MKKAINKTLGKLGYTIQRNRTKEDVIYALQKKLTSSKANVTIFDVGAYLGETVLAYNELFNRACQIYAFEPFEKTFQQLKKNTQRHSNIQLVNAALGNERKEVTFHINNFAATNSILASDEKAHETWGRGLMETQKKIQVPMQTIDDFVVEHQIECIDILKLDTQGSEDLVLEGAKNSIAKGIIKVICTEMIVMPTYKDQKPLHEILKIYNDFGFSLYNIYSALAPDGRLRFLDGIFIYEK